MLRKFDMQAKADKSADVFLYGNVGADYFEGVSALNFVKELQGLGDVDLINVRINSLGGSIVEGFAIYESLRQHKARVRVQIDGIAASIASVIAMAGDEVAIAESAFVMIHRGWTIVAGDADEIRNEAKVLEMMEQKIIDAYLRRAAKSSREELFALMKAETWFPADEALAIGFASSIIKPDEAAAMAFDLSRFKHPPAALASRSLSPSGKVADVLALKRAEEEVAVRLRLLDVT